MLQAFHAMLLFLHGIWECHAVGFIIVVGYIKLLVTVGISTSWYKTKIQISRGILETCV